jgi:histidyl-tRNA synthetase
MSKPSIPQGTRDFSPELMSKRKFILNTIESVYQSFGFMQLETPAMENLNTLTGKYGNEGDQLLFKILNSGDYIKDLDLNAFDSKSLTPKIAEKGLRYDLTVPLARFVAMHRHEISFPFKRYQIQPVWRADRPQKGRYREFWQCDADVLGTDSLLCEADFIKIYQTVFSKLGIQDYEIRINHRKLLEAVCEKADAKQHFKTITIIIDKADKIGIDGVARELNGIGLNETQVQTVLSLLNKKSLSIETIAEFEQNLSGTESIAKAVEDFNKLIAFCGADLNKIVLDGSLARGLDYYTGCIFEVVPTNVKIGSISGGGRYDNLTEVFGLKEKVSGIGISFGIDRLYDVMEELQLFVGQTSSFADVLFCPMDEAAINYCLPLANQCREKGYKTEIYPSASKLKKQLDYANTKNIKWAIIVGDSEIEKSEVSIKNLVDGNQQTIDIENFINSIS